MMGSEKSARIKENGEGNAMLKIIYFFILKWKKQKSRSKQTIKKTKSK